MHHLRVDPTSPNDESIRRAAEAIQAGNLMAFPTETVYGLGADALNPDAVRKIFKAKGRPVDNPLIVHIAGRDQLSLLTPRFPQVARALANRFWPGPLTLVLPRLPHVPDETTGGLDTVAVRIPDHPVARALLMASQRAIAAPSANRSGRPSPTRAEHVIDDLGEHVAVLLDAGACPIGLESTVVDVSEGRPVLLRPGGISHEALEAVVGEVLTPAQESTALSHRSPGTRYRHYAPRARLVLASPGVPAQMARLARRWQQSGERVGTISRRPLPFDAVAGVVAGSIEEYAAGLFAALRELDAAGCTVIVAEAVEEEGLGRAVMDRLRRAASGSTAPHESPDTVALP